MKCVTFFYPLLIMFSCCMLHPFFAQAQDLSDHDTAYYVTYPHTLVGRFYLSKKYTSFTLPSANDGQDINYRANSPLTMGLGATYNNLTLNLGYGFDFLNKNSENKGKTKSIDLQAHMFPHKGNVDKNGW